LSLFEQSKRANALLDKINEVLRKKLEDINQLRAIEATLCQKLDENPIELDQQGTNGFVR
jgi:hypothetical protein